MISRPPTHIFWKERKTYYKKAQDLFQSSTLSCSWVSPKPRENWCIQYIPLWNIQLLSSEVPSWVAKLFPRSISQCVTDCFKKEADHNRNKTNNNIMSGAFNKSRLTNSELCGQQQALCTYKCPLAGWLVWGKKDAAFASPVFLRVELSPKSLGGLSVHIHSSFKKLFRTYQVSQFDKAWLSCLQKTLTLYNIKLNYSKQSLDREISIRFIPICDLICFSRTGLCPTWNFDYKWLYIACSIKTASMPLFLKNFYYHLLLIMCFLLWLPCYYLACPFCIHAFVSKEFVMTNFICLCSASDTSLLAY